MQTYRHSENTELLELEANFIMLVNAVLYQYKPLQIFLKSAKPPKF